MLRLHEAWWAIAQSIADGSEFWICNATKTLYLRNRISHKVCDAISERIEVERVIQGRSNYDGLFSALWVNFNPYTQKARIARIQFISAELRRLSIPGTKWGAVE